MPQQHSAGQSLSATQQPTDVRFRSHWRVVRLKTKLPHAFGLGQQKHCRLTQPHPGKLLPPHASSVRQQSPGEISFKSHMLLLSQTPAWQSTAMALHRTASHSQRHEL